MKARVFILVLFAIAASCTHKSYVAQLPVTTNTCDTQHVSYTNNILPVIKANCYGCHSTSVTASGGLDLENFTSLKTYLGYGFRGDSIYGSKFYHCITHSLNALPMPPSYVLDSCDLKLIHRWISMGAPEN